MARKVLAGIYTENRGSWTDYAVEISQRGPGKGISMESLSHGICYRIHYQDTYEGAIALIIHSLDPSLFGR